MSLFHVWKLHVIPCKVYKEDPHESIYINFFSPRLKYAVALRHGLCVVKMQKSMRQGSKRERPQTLFLLYLKNYLLSNCISYCTESAQNEYKYPTILYSWLLYSTVQALILLHL